MKSIIRFVEQTKKKFEKGTKLEKYMPLFESFETFLMLPGHVTKKGSHIRDAVDLKRVMSTVIISLIPALLFGIWNTGHFHFMALGIDATFIEKFIQGAIVVLPIIAVSYIAGLGVEFIFVYLKGHEISEGFLVTGILIPLIMPATIPLWMVAVATIFSVVFAKEAFGGTGMNIFNPALIARAFVFFAYPAQISGDKIWVSGLSDGSQIVDNFSGATILAQKAVGNTEIFNGLKDVPVTTWDMLLGTIPGSIGETSFIAIMIGAAILIYTGIGSWRIITSVFAGGLFMGLILNLLAPETNALLTTSAVEHLLIGGFAFGAVFMATDPVTASQTNVGKYIYGFLTGLLAILIRTLNPAYPEGMMLAILFMNVLAPLIDYYVVQANIKRRLKRIPVPVQQAQ